MEVEKNGLGGELGALSFSNGDLFSFLFPPHRIMSKRNQTLVGRGKKKKPPFFFLVICMYSPIPFSVFFYSHLFLR